jgi:hypothetical protein
MVLIHECGNIEEKQKEKETLLYSHYKLQGTVDLSTRQRTPVFKCIHPETISGRIYVIDPTPGNGGTFWKEREPNSRDPLQFHIIKIKDRKSHWPNAFLKPTKKK